MKLKAVDDTFLSCPTCADIAKSTRERPAQKRDLKIINQTIKSRCPRNHQNRRSAVDMHGCLWSLRHFTKSRSKSRRRICPVCSYVLRYPFCELISTMRKFVVFNATIALRRSRRIFGSNTFAKRASNVWMAIWEWGISPQEGLFLQALRQVSDHVDMARLCVSRVLYY